MKKALFVTVCAAVLGFSVQSFAENMARIVPTTTVSEALLMEDDTPVALVGTITQTSVMKNISLRITPELSW